MDKKIFQFQIHNKSVLKDGNIYATYNKTLKEYDMFIFYVDPQNNKKYFIENGLYYPTKKEYVGYKNGEIYELVYPSYNRNYVINNVIKFVEEEPKKWLNEHPEENFINYCIEVSMIIENVFEKRISPSYGIITGVISGITIISLFIYYFKSSRKYN